MIPRVLAISPPAPGPWCGEVEALAEAGVEALVLRLVAGPEHLAAVLRAVAGCGLPLLVRPCLPGDVALARACGAGLHLPASWAGPPPGAPLVGASCHDLAELRRAAAAGCDYALVSPVFSPGSKPGDPRPTLGLDGLAVLCAAAELPVLALGGLNAARAAACVAAGAHGVAGIGAFFTGDRVDRASAAAVVAALAPLS